MRQVRINGVWNLLLPEHRAARPDWTTEKGWERERLNAMRRHIRAGDLVVDVGAEEGDLSALYAKWGAKVVLIEPNPMAWPNIKAIWEANELPVPADWFVGFASDDTLLDPPANDVDAEYLDGWPSCAWGPVVGDHGFRVLAQQADATPQVTLDDFCFDRALEPDVITVDVEGAEWAVLRGAFHVLDEYHPLVFCSVHPDFMVELYGERVQHLFEYMERRGYEKKLLAYDHELHILFHHPEGRRIK